MVVVVDKIGTLIWCRECVRWITFSKVEERLSNVREVQDVRVAFKLRAFGKGMREMPKKIVALQFEEQEGIITVVRVKWCTS